MNYNCNALYFSITDSEIMREKNGELLSLVNFCHLMHIEIKLINLFTLIFRAFF